MAAMAQLLLTYKWNVSLADLLLPCLSVVLSGFRRIRVPNRKFSYRHRKKPEAKRK